MKFRKLVSMSIVGMLVITLATGCGNDTKVEDTNSTAVEQQANQNNMQQVLVDNEIIKITILDTEFVPYDAIFEQGSYNFKVLVENKTDMDIMVSTNNCTESDLDMSANHYMTQNVQANKKIYTDFSLFIDSYTKDVYTSDKDFDDITIDFYVCETTNFTNLCEWTTTIKNGIVEQDSNQEQNQVKEVEEKDEDKIVKENKEEQVKQQAKDANKNQINNNTVINGNEKDNNTNSDIDERDNYVPADKNNNGVEDAPIYDPECDINNDGVLDNLDDYDDSPVEDDRPTYQREYTPKVQEEPQETGIIPKEPTVVEPTE